MPGPASSCAGSNSSARTGKNKAQIYKFDTNPCKMRLSSGAFFHIIETQQGKRERRNRMEKEKGVIIWKECKRWLVYFGLPGYRAWWRRSWRAGMIKRFFRWLWLSLWQQIIRASHVKSCRRGRQQNRNTARLALTLRNDAKQLFLNSIASIAVRYMERF